MEIGPLSVEDEAAYTAFFLRGVREHPGCFRITEQDILAAPSPFRNTGPGAFTLAAFGLNRALSGVVSFQREEKTKMVHKGLLYRMYVSAESSGQGLGRALLIEAIRRARELSGLEQINLTVLANNLKAKELYRRTGFAPFSVERNAIKSDGKYFAEEQWVVFL